MSKRRRKTSKRTLSLNPNVWKLNTRLWTHKLVYSPVAYDFDLLRVPSTPVSLAHAEQVSFSLARLVFVPCIDDLERSEPGCPVPQ